MIKRSLQLLKRNLTRPRGIDFDSAYPVSDYFGDDRGTPEDRFYIDAFLRANRKLVRGRVLEVAADTYTRKYGTRLDSMDVLHYERSAPGATLIGDLSRPETLPESLFDCFICTQTIHVIYNYMDAIRGARQLLKPGGTLLCTLSGIAQISRYDMDRWGDYWRFTTLSARQLLAEHFSKDSIVVQSYGNVLVAASFLYGLARQQLTSEEL